MTSGYKQCCGQRLPVDHLVFMNHDEPERRGWYLGVYEVTDGPVYMPVRFCPNCGAKLMPPLGV